ncbi:hypothetical protein ASD11_14945 [Aeromicrobium sp. Root495]|nr:hypothetical protein ASD11_14945 [Aeromicrobium sp. Root495]
MLPRSRGEAGEPFLPEIGQVYQVNTYIYTFGTDPAPERPALVLNVPSKDVSFAPIQIVTRTSQDVAGVPHPADDSLGLDKDGVFSTLGSVEKHLWRPGNVQLLGWLPEPYVSRVIERFS